MSEVLKCSFIFGASKASNKPTDNASPIHGYGTLLRFTIEINNGVEKT